MRAKPWDIYKTNISRFLNSYSYDSQTLRYIENKISRFLNSYSYDSQSLSYIENKISRFLNSCSYDNQTFRYTESKISRFINSYLYDTRPLRYTENKIPRFLNSYSYDKNCAIYYNSIEIITNWSDNQIYIGSNVVQIRYPGPEELSYFLRQIQHKISNFSLIYILRESII